MNVVTYHTSADKLRKITSQLREHGYNILNSTRNPQRLQDLVAEFDATVAFINPAIFQFMEMKSEITAASPRECMPAKPSYDVLVKAGHKPLLSQRLWEASTDLVSERFDQGPTCVYASMYLSEHSFLLPGGLEKLPSAWLVALPGLFQAMLSTIWASTKVPFFCDFTVNSGALDIAFHGETHATCPKEIRMLFDKIRISLNRQLYPSRWRPLLAEHSNEVYNEHPELREELESIDNAIMLET